MHSKIDLNEIELHLVLEAIKISKAKNKIELVTYLQAMIRGTFGSHESAEFKKNRQAMRFWNTLQKIIKNLPDN